METGKNVASETNLEVDNNWKDLCYLLRRHALVKKEVYFLAQVRNMYIELRRELEEELLSPQASIMKND